MGGPGQAVVSAEWRGCLCCAAEADALRRSRDALVQISHPRRKGHEVFPSEVMDPVQTRSKEAKRNVPTPLRRAADAKSRKAKARADAAPADGEPCPPEGEDFAKTPAHGGALLAVS